jgi:hypothetical protein
MKMVESQAEMRAEQAAQNAKNDDRFERMLTAFMHHSTKNDSNETPDDNTTNRHKHNSKKKKSRSQHKQPTATYGVTMDTEHDTIPATDDKQRPRETDHTMLPQPRSTTMMGPGHTDPPHIPPTENDDDFEDYQHLPNGHQGPLDYKKNQTRISRSD